MSDLMFPQLRGVGWNTRLTPQFATGRQQARSGRTVRAAFRAQPLIRITLNYADDGFLGDEPVAPAADGTLLYSDFETMLGFFGQHRGPFESFLFQGVNDIDRAKFTRSGERLGVGDGSQTDFQLVRNIGGWLEFVYWPMGAPTLYVDGAQVAATDLGLGLYRLGAAPAAGALVTADFVHAYRCTFDEDEMEFSNWAAYFWDCGTVPLITVKP